VGQLCADQGRRLRERVHSARRAHGRSQYWYRANFANRAQHETSFAPFDVSTPTLTLWGNRDPFIGRPATACEHGYMRGPYRFLELDAGHWLMHEAADVCRREIMAHLRAYPIEASLSG
jgi:pimeloyl-ACP methyl ester carboxylesterase